MSELQTASAGDTHTPRWKKITKSGRPARKTVRKIVHENHVCAACGVVFVREAGRGRQYCTIRCWDKLNPRKHARRRRKFERSKGRKQWVRKWSREYSRKNYVPSTRSKEELSAISSANFAKARARLRELRRDPNYTTTRPWPEWKRKESRLTRALKAAETKTVTLGPQQIKRMRALIMECVEEQLAEAHEAVMNRDGKSWTPTQARIFDTLLKKVLPDLNITAHREDTKTKPVAQMTIDELEATVAAAKRAKRLGPESDPTIDGTFAIDENAPDAEQSE